MTPIEPLRARTPRRGRHGAGMTSESPQTSDGDQELLDSALEAAIQRLEDGQPVDVAALLGEREHLRGRMVEVVRLAREIAVGRTSGFPAIRGYSILTEIGHGGMGTVYLARQDRVGGRLVALKVLPDAAALSPRARERFVREGEVLAKLRHPNVITIYDVVQSGGLLAYAMEWVDGKSLAQLIDRVQGSGLRVQQQAPLVPDSLVRDSHLAPAGIPSRERTPPEGIPAGSRAERGFSAQRRSVRRDSAQRNRQSAIRNQQSAIEMVDVCAALHSPPGASDGLTYPVFVCRIGIAVARALAEVHRAGLLHRDVKPSNILLRRDGTPLLSDFGLARELDSELTQPGHFAGTPAYASPEQLRGGAPGAEAQSAVGGLDARSDVYSLGVALYHALALRLPYSRSDSPTALLREIESGRAEPLRRANPGLSHLNRG